MKRNYVKPEGKMVSLNVNENISASGAGILEMLFGVKYTITNPDKPEIAQKFIADSDILSVDQTIGENIASNVIDWFAVFFYPEYHSCLYNPAP